MSWFSKERTVFAKLAYYLIAMPTLGLGLVLYYDVMSLVTIFSNQNYVVLAKLPESAQIPGDDSAKIWCTSKNLTTQRNELIQQKYDMHSIWLRLGLVVIWPRVRVRITNMLCQQKKFELIQRKCAVSAKTCWVIKVPDDDSTKESCVSKNLLSQQKSTDLRRDLSRSTTTYFGTTSSNVYCVWTLSGIWFLSAAAAARTLTVVLTSSI